MKFACPGCAAEMSANPPKPGRFSLKCTSCGGALVLKVSLMTLADEKAGAQREKSLATFPSNPTADPNATQASITERQPRPPADTNQTAASLPDGGMSESDDTETTRGPAPKPDRNDQTVVTRCDRGPHAGERPGRPLPEHGRVDRRAQGVAGGAREERGQADGGATDGVRGGW